ncbi:MAG: tRNA (guanosine(37)-N1)-methyltransferase TrmD [Sporichthyaceae bacterium]
MRIDVVSIFPAYLAPLELSLVGKAIRDGLLDLAVHDLREWTTDVHRTVDDSPYGGGAGMVMKPEPWGAALDSVLAGGPGPAQLIVPTPAGRPFTQAFAAELAHAPWLVFAPARYEGIDSRVAAQAVERPQIAAVHEISIGDYVLAGGEAAVLVIVEAIARLLPGVLGNAESIVEESHAAGLLEAPSYTKPQEWRGHGVPDVLRSGDHGAIARWRRDEALRRTATVRPDLLQAFPAADLDKKDRATLNDLGWSVSPDGRIGPAAQPVAD